MDRQNGVITISVETLRAMAAGEGRKTRLDAVRTEIIERLDDMKISIWPDLPRRAQGHHVIIYYRGTEAHEVIRLFEAGAAVPALARLLRRLNTPAVPREGLAAVREMWEQVGDRLEAMAEEQPEPGRRKRRRR